MCFIDKIHKLLKNEKYKMSRIYQKVARPFMFLFTQIFLVKQSGNISSNPNHQRCINIHLIDEL